MDLVNTIEKLSNLDADLHWFCPRSYAGDDAIYFDDDILHTGPIVETEQEKAMRQKKIDEAVRRKESALNAAQIIAFDGDDAVPYQEKLKKGLKRQLARCDVCIREFHRGRAWLRTRLEDEYPPDDVLQFMQKYDGMNDERIVAGLRSATELLLDLPPEERSIVATGDAGMYAFLEALNCKPFLRNEELLRTAFDQPFKLVRSSGKKLLLPSCAPGMGAFLFSTDPERYAWAERNINRLKRALLPNEFEFSIKPFLEPAANRVIITQLDVNFLPSFWSAMRTIISKLDHSLITDHLRPMNVNIYTLSLDHFQVDAPHFTDLTKCYEMLLQKAGHAFWDAMNPATPQNVVEQICSAPRMEQLLTLKEEYEHGRYEHIKKHLDWVGALIPSIRGANLVPPLRTLLDLFLHKFQGEQYSNDGSTVTWEKGKSSLLNGIKKVMREVDGGPTYTHLIEAVAKDHIPVILKDIEDIGQTNDGPISEKRDMDLQILESILAMDVKSLRRDRRCIVEQHELDHEIGLSSLNVWKSSTRQVSAKHRLLASAILSAITGILPLEKLPPKIIKEAPKPAESWNNALNRVHNYVVEMLQDNLDAFSPDQLSELFAEGDATKGVISLVCSGEDHIHQAAVGILKTLSSADGRRESLMCVLEKFFQSTLAAISFSLKLLTEAQVYGPCHNVLKVCRDLLSCLCDSQDGLLRSKTLSEPELVALRMFWNRIWTILEVIFEKTESWSSLGHDKQLMQDFCRETMDFADFAFDQYSVIAGALESTEKDSSSEDAKKLLRQPNQAFHSTAKWLRLRDQYLIDKAVSLTTKILDRLGDAGIVVSDKSAEFIENIVTSDVESRVKTKLTMNQKALLQQTLEKHLGESLSEVVEIDPPARMKQSSLSSWAKPSSGQQSSRSGSSTPVPGVEKSKPLDMKAWSAVADRQKAQDASQKKPMQKLPSLQSQKQAQLTQQKQANFLQQRKKQMAEQEKQRQAALARANQGAGSGVSGIGNYGNDISNEGQTVMVDDDELDDEDEEEEEDLDDDLFGTSKLKKEQRPGLNVSGTTGLRPEVKKGPTRIHRTQRSTKDMRARLAPKLDELHRTLLGWEFFHDGDYPPGAEQEHFRQVSNSFRDPISYKLTFEPLLTLEAWQGMVKAREEGGNKPYEIKVSSRSNVDRMVEISSGLGHAENRDLQLTEGDIILLSKAAKPADSPDSPNCLARIYRVKRQKAHLEIVYQLLPSSPLAGQLTVQTLVYGLKIQSITPLEREYGALQAVQYYDLCNQIVQARPSPRINYSERQIAQVQDVYNLNRAQSEAVNAALENEGFSLIQGPPGSGKTKTIVAIVGGLLTPTLSASSKGATRISVPKANGSTTGAGDAGPKKLLVCAPSNAAVDELVMRLKEGVKTKSGGNHKINVVRLGRSDAINSQVQDVTIDVLVSKKIGGGESDAQTRSRNAELFKHHEAISKELRQMYDKRDAHDKGESPLEPEERRKLDESVSTLKRQKAELGNRIDAVKDQERNAGREQELNRKRAQQAVLDEAHVICATLSGSGHDMFQNLNIEFETVVIDEAAQCVEMSSLIPLKYSCIKCIMVGDPKQLPPTVFSKEAARFQYEQSLFVRMQNNHPHEVHLLDTQYRMHPDISVFPSRTFYDGLLKDGPGMAAARKQPWHASALLAPYRFFDVQGQHQSAPKGHSLINIAEIDVAMALYDRLRQDYKDYDFTSRIGIITPYKSQLRELKNRFSNRYGPEITDVVEFNTTDAFQGRESEIIIFSCVRASPAGGIGFLQDIRRMNVGLTRAKSSLWVLGNSESLIRGQYWKKLVEDAQARDAYTTGHLLSMLKKPSSAFPASGSDTRSMLDINNHVAQMGSEQSSRVASANGSRRPSVEAGGALSSYRDSPDGVATASTTTNTAEADKMEGVRRRFEDRPRTKQQHPSSGDPSHIKRLKQESPSDDVEMAEADTAIDHVGAGAKDTGGIKRQPGVDFPLYGAAKDSSRSRTGTPASDDGGHSSTVSADGGPATKPRPAVVQRPQQVLKKRPAAASPFLPKKPKPQR